jgi:hypothetical protein
MLAGTTLFFNNIANVINSKKNTGSLVCLKTKRNDHGCFFNDIVLSETKVFLDGMKILKIYGIVKFFF